MKANKKISQQFYNNKYLKVLNNYFKNYHFRKNYLSSFRKTIYLLSSHSSWYVSSFKRDEEEEEKEIYLSFAQGSNCCSSFTFFSFLFVEMIQQTRSLSNIALLKKINQPLKKTNPLACFDSFHCDSSESKENWHDILLYCNASLFLTSHCVLCWCARIPADMTSQRNAWNPRMWLTHHAFYSETTNTKLSTNYFRWNFESLVSRL